MKKKLQFKVYGLPSSPTNWGEAADILRSQQGEFQKTRRPKESVVARLARIERMLSNK